MKSLYLALALYLLILYPSCKSDATYDDDGKIDFTSVQVEGGLISGLVTNDQQVFIFNALAQASGAESLAAPCSVLKYANC